MTSAKSNSPAKAPAATPATEEAMPKSLQFVQDAGKALFGERWKSDLAREIELEYNTVHSWFIQNMEVSDKRILQIKIILQNRASQINRLIDNAPLNNPR